MYLCNKKQNSAGQEGHRQPGVRASSHASRCLHSGCVPLRRTWESSLSSIFRAYSIRLLGSWCGKGMSRMDFEVAHCLHACRPWSQMQTQSSQMPRLLQCACSSDARPGMRTGFTDSKNLHFLFARRKPRQTSDCKAPEAQSAGSTCYGIMQFVHAPLCAHHAAPGAQESHRRTSPTASTLSMARAGGSQLGPRSWQLPSWQLVGCKYYYRFLGFWCFSRNWMGVSDPGPQLHPAGAALGLPWMRSSCTC